MHSVNPLDSQMKPAYGKGLLQTGIGYLGGHVINSINQYMHPGKVILGAPPVLVITPLQAGYCSFVFAIIDRIAIKILQSKQNEPPANQLVRMAVTIPLSAAFSAACLGISFNVALLAILTSVIGLTILLSMSKAYNQLAYS